MPGLKAEPGGMAVHMARHARARNMGQKAAEKRRRLPEADVQGIEKLGTETPKPERGSHPILSMARACGIGA